MPLIVVLGRCYAFLVHVEHVMAFFQENQKVFVLKVPMLADSVPCCPVNFVLNLRKVQLAVVLDDGPAHLEEEVLGAHQARWRQAQMIVVLYIDQLVKL